MADEREEKGQSEATPATKGTAGLGGNSLAEGTARASTDENDLTKGERRRGGQGG